MAVNMSTRVRMDLSRRVMSKPREASSEVLINS